MRSLGAPAHLFSLSGSSAVAVGAHKMLEIMERDQLFTQSAQKGAYFMDELKTLQEKHELIGDVRGIALSIGVDLVKSRATMEKNYDAAAKISYACMERGLLLTFVGQSTLRVQPPLVITTAQIDAAVEILDRALCAYEAGEISDEILEQVKGW
jgi:4-aminobutyrate aminotransferase